MTHFNYDYDETDTATAKSMFRLDIRRSAGDADSILGANVDATHIVMMQLGALQAQLKAEDIAIPAINSREALIIDDFYQQHKDDSPTLPYQFKTDLGVGDINSKSVKVAELYRAAKEKS